MTRKSINSGECLFMFYLYFVFLCIVNSSNGADITTSDTFAEYISTYFVGEENPNIIGRLMDPDNDGLANLMEYYLNTIPSLPSHGVIRYNYDNEQLVFYYNRAVEHNNLIVEWHESEDLQTWQRRAPDSEEIIREQIVNDRPTYEMKTAFSYAANQPVFFRLVIKQDNAETDTTSFLVDAHPGTDETIRLPVDSISLSGIVKSNNYTENFAIISNWTLDDGPAAVVFSDPSNLDTRVRFTTHGTYVLRLTAQDALQSGSDTVTVTVMPELTQTYGIEALRSQIADAITSNQNEVTLNPGIYRGTVADNVFIEIRNVSDLTIYAYGVHLICERFTRALDFYQCENVAVYGLTVDYDPVPFTQGTIAGVADDDTWVDVEIHDGYPVVAYDRIDIIDPRTRHRKHGMPFLWGARAEIRPGNIVRVMRDGFGGSAAVGDLASMSGGPEGIPHAIQMSQCRHLTLQDVTVHAAPGYGIINGEGYGDHHYDNVRIVPGPRPEGATEDRLLTTNWDAIQFNSSRKGSVMENSEIESAGDDSWSLSSRDYMILAVEGNVVWLIHRVPYQMPLEVSDRLAVSLDSPKPVITLLERVESISEVPISNALYTNIQNAPNQFAYYGFEFNNIVRATLDRTSPWPDGTSVYSPDRNCDTFALRNNIFYSPGRAGLINGASNGVIENNVYVNVHAALSFYPNIPAGGGTGSENIVFRNNYIRYSGHFAPAPWSMSGAAATVSREGGPRPEVAAAGVYRNIEICNNIFEKVAGPSLLITSTDTLTIANNIFMETNNARYTEMSGTLWGIRGDELGWFRNNTNVTVNGNQIINRGEFGERGLVGLLE